MWRQRGGAESAPHPQIVILLSAGRARDTLRANSEISYFIFENWLKIRTDLGKTHAYRTRCDEVRCDEQRWHVCEWMDGWMQLLKNVLLIFEYANMCHSRIFRGRARKRKKNEFHFHCENKDMEFATRVSKYKRKQKWSSYYASWIVYSHRSEVILGLSACRMKNQISSIFFKKNNFDFSITVEDDFRALVHQTNRMKRHAKKNPNTTQDRTHQVSSAQRLLLINSHDRPFTVLCPQTHFSNYKKTKKNISTTTKTISTLCVCLTGRCRNQFIISRSGLTG